MKVVMGCARWRRIAAVALFSAVSAAAHAAADPAASYPDRPIRLVVPFAPGGANDLFARLVAQNLGERIKGSVIVDNRGGADGIIGTGFVANAAPDGYTLLLASVSYSTNAATHKLPYDPLTSLEPVALIGTGSEVLAVSPSVPVHTVGELIALAKSKPGGLNYASAGVGGINHFAGELFKKIAGVNIAHVPYKGGGQAMTDVIGGQVEILFNSLPSALTYIRSGQLRALGVGSQTRSAALPDVPTISESGAPGYEAVLWWGILTTAGTPPEIVAKLNSEINAVMRDPKVAKQFADGGADPVTATAQAFKELVARDVKKWKAIAEDVGITAD